MPTETRGWSAVIVTGDRPRLIIEGEGHTHPYAIVYLSEQGLFTSSPSVLRFDLKVIGDTGTRGLLEWKRITYERVLGIFLYDQVVIGDAGPSPIFVDVEQMTPAAYARETGG